MGNLKMPSTNIVVIAGRAAWDPELRYTQSGKAVANLRIANTNYYRDQSGELKEDTSWIDIVVWGNAAESVIERIKKGMGVQIQGSLKSQEWEDKETGLKRSAIKVNAFRVDALEWPDDGQGGGEQAPASNRESRRYQPREEPQQQQEPPAQQYAEDDIPF